MCMCKYCGAAEIIPHEGIGEPHIWFNSEGRYYLETYDYYNNRWVLMEINYCPMCGCKL